MEKQRLDKIIASTGRWSRREARDLAVLLEHYYERGYRRNDRYTI